MHNFKKQVENNLPTTDHQLQTTHHILKKDSKIYVAEGI